MPEEITFTVPAVPVAQPRQRHRVMFVAGRAMAQNYTPAKSPVNDYKATIRMACQAAYAGPPLEGPLSVTIDAVFPRPKRLCWKKRPMPRERHYAKPDRDNVEKSTLDALKGLLFVDDAQVCDGPVRKFYAAGDEQPHVRVTVEVLEATVG